MGNDPAVSVVMPVRNGLPFLDAAISSILEQDFGDFEFVILDDGSRDATPQRLMEWAQRDRRIRLLRADEPLGLVASSQAVIGEARAPLVARMDADDISRPDRLCLQIATLREHPKAVMVASLARGIDERGKIVRPVDIWRLRPGAATFPGPHSSWMFRREAFAACGGYLDGTDGWEDTSLVYRLARLGDILVSPEPLVDFRYHALGATVTHPQLDREMVMVAHAREFGRSGSEGVPLGFAPDAYRMRAGMRVWAGHRPDIRARFPRLRSPRWLSRSVPILAYATWGSLAPRSMRFTMASLIIARNRLYRSGIEPGKPVVWTNA